MSKMSNSEFIQKVREFFNKAKNISEPVIEGNDDYVVKKISDFIGLKQTKHQLRKINIPYVNAFKVKDNMIFFYPANDGMPTCSFEFYSNGKLVIGNQHNFSEIENLDEILIEMVRIYRKSLDSRVVLDPYFFMLELTDPVTENYHGKATLVATEKAVRNQKLNNDHFDEANQHFINKFLDHFIGWNFGKSVKRNEVLRKELEELNQKAMYMGLRKAAGTGFEVYESGDVVHYDLPIDKQSARQHKAD